MLCSQSPQSPRDTKSRDNLYGTGSGSARGAARKQADKPSCKWMLAFKGRAAVADARPRAQCQPQ